MGTKLSTYSDSKNEPVVNITGTKGQYFVGTVKSRKTIDSSFKDEQGNPRKRNIYTLAVKDTDMETMLKEGKEYKPVDIAAGDAVVVFAPTRLDNALKQTKDGDTVKIVYLGLGKATRKGGKPHEFDVELL